MQLDSDKLQLLVKELFMVPSRTGVLPSVFVKAVIGKALTMSLCGEAYATGSIPIHDNSEEPTTVYLDRQSLGLFVSQVRSDRPTKLTVGSGAVTLSQGRRRVKLHCREGVSGHADAKLFKGEVVTLSQDDLERLAVCATFAAYDPVYPEYGCIHLSSKGAFATDQYCVVRAPLLTKRSLAVPSLVPTIMRALNLDTMTIMAKGVNVKGSHTKFFQPIHTKRKFPLSTVTKVTLETKASLICTVTVGRLQSVLGFFSKVGGSEGEAYISVGDTSQAKLRVDTPQASFDAAVTLRSASKAGDTVLYLPRFVPYLKALDPKAPLKLSLSDAFVRCECSEFVYVQSLRRKPGTSE